METYIGAWLRDREEGPVRREELEKWELGCGQVGFN